ncbi:uncharacterized protein LOC105688414 isoform X2 [Athalia rosae]|uniref:uncharacterized protein LOC105688414 isoform X2 n=1 Tax=Athalia rosae TaxID=37344 RepID=UPI0020340597|nr:uncharacterized protein LOC105688414 isoform X2 [Athalia rosae]
MCQVPRITIPQIVAAQKLGFGCRRKMKVKRSKSRSPEPSSSNEYKRPRIIDSDQKNDDQLESNLLNLSDDVLLNIMKYLNPQDLMALSLCCQRLEQVTRDRTLWSSVDFRKSPIMLEDLEKYVKFFRPWITKLRIRGNLQSDRYQGLSQSFFTAIGEICNRLKELTVEEYAIDGNKIQITDFPKMIETLSLKGCDLYHLQTNKSYFFKMELHMPNLTCLILSNCEWFTPHSLMVISKMPKLKELRLDSCHRLSECLAYASLATKFGFKTLEVLDLRDTALGDSEISCFKSTKTLTHLYLECPPMLRKVRRPSEGTPPHEPPMHRPVFEDHNLLQLLVDEGNLMPRHNFELCLISDRAVCALGSYVCDQRILNSIEGMIFVEEDRRIVNNPNLKALVVRYYPQVTNQSLVHLAANASSLEYLDVTGTAVTQEGVQTFRSQKPGVEILSSFDET